MGAISHLMNNRAFVLVFSLASAPNMDARRIYSRRRNEDGSVNVVPCRVSRLSSTDSLIHAMRGSEITHRVYFDENPNLREENRLEIKGLQYMLIGVPVNPSQSDHHWELDVKMITQQNENGQILE
jgi:hypothetical protein